jgi:hypothetical protein
VRVAALVPRTAVASASGGGEFGYCAARELRERGREDEHDQDMTRKVLLITVVVFVALPMAALLYLFRTIDYGRLPSHEAFQKVWRRPSSQ